MKTSIGNISTSIPSAFSKFRVEAQNTIIRITKTGKKIIGKGVGIKSVDRLIELNKANHPTEAIFLNGHCVHYGSRTRTSCHWFEKVLIRAKHYTAIIVAILMFANLLTQCNTATAQGPEEVLYLQGYVLNTGDSKERTQIVVLDERGDTVHVDSVKKKYKLKFKLNAVYTVIMSKGDSTKQFNIDTRTGIIAFSKLILDIDWGSRYNFAVLNISDNGRELVVHGEYKTIELKE